jgi:hypothetical protein
MSEACVILDTHDENAIKCLCLWERDARFWDVFKIPKRVPKLAVHYHFFTLNMNFVIRKYCF